MGTRAHLLCFALLACAPARHSIDSSARDATAWSSLDIDEVKALDLCRRTEACREEGRCSTRGDVCVAAFTEDCRASLECRARGRCTASRGACIIATPDDCRRARPCWKGGDCYLDPEDGECDDGLVRADGGMMAGGITAVAVGSTAVFAGLLTNLLTFGGEVEPSTHYAAWGLMGGGAAVATGVGIPLWVAGGKKVSRYRNTDLAISPTSVTLRVP